MRISFRSKYGAAGGANEDREYAQIWERPTNRARRCLGKGAAADKLVLDSALRQVLGAKEREPRVPMECEEIGRQEEQMDISADNGETFENFNLFGNIQTFITESLLTVNPSPMEIEANKNENKNTSLDPSRQSEQSEMESTPSSANIANTSLWMSKTISGVTEGQGGVRCVLARALETSRESNGHNSDT